MLSKPKSINRLIGYLVTEILWKEIKSIIKNKSLSAGRVQSVILKIIIENEKNVNLRKIIYINQDYLN